LERKLGCESQEHDIAFATNTSAPLDKVGLWPGPGSTFEGGALDILADIVS